MSLLNEVFSDTIQWDVKKRLAVVKRDSRGEAGACDPCEDL